MESIKFDGCNVVVAEGQDEYQNLHAQAGEIPCAPKPGGCPICGAHELILPFGAAINSFECGSHSYNKETAEIMQSDACKSPTVPGLTFCMKLTAEEIDSINQTGVLWHTVLTFGNPLQPQLMSVQKPEWVS